MPARTGHITALLTVLNQAAIGRAALDGALAYLGGAFAAAMVTLNDMTGADDELRPLVTWTAAGAVPLVAMACLKLTVAGHRLSLRLHFGQGRDGLDAVERELATLSIALLPVVARWLAEREHALLLNALDATRSGVIITEAALLDPPGPIIVYVNQATCAMTGHAREELLGRSPRVLQGRETEADALARIRQALAAAEPISIELCNYRRDGTPFWVALDITPVGDGDRVTHFIAVQTDITQRRAAQDALLRAEKLKTIGQITGGIAHDFNNLLTVIGLNLEAVLEADTLPPDLRGLLQPAWHATRRGSELTAQMLSYARRKSLEPRVVNLSSLVEALRPLLLRALGRGHSLTIAAGRGRLPVRIDPGQFENALMNLVINARHALGTVGRIDIAIARSRRRVLHSTSPDLVPPGEYVRVRVADNGHGIAPEVLPRIFEPFFTTRPSGGGSGLGLSMVHSFVHQSQGHLAIVSGPATGTTIDLYFPLA